MHILPTLYIECVSEHLAQSHRSSLQHCDSEGQTGSANHIDLDDSFVDVSYTNLLLTKSRKVLPNLRIGGFLYMVNKRRMMKPATPQKVEEIRSEVPQQKK